MNSGEAHGWLIANVLNGCLSLDWPDEHDVRMRLALGLDPDHVTTYCPECCGPCGALRGFFATPRGRAEADSYTRQLPKGAREWVWMNRDASVDWGWVRERMSWGWCPNHEQE